MGRTKRRRLEGTRSPHEGREEENDDHDTERTPVYAARSNPAELSDSAFVVGLARRNDVLPPRHGA